MMAVEKWEHKYQHCHKCKNTIYYRISQANVSHLEISTRAYQVLQLQSSLMAVSKYATGASRILNHADVKN